MSAELVAAYKAALIAVRVAENAHYAAQAAEDLAGREVTEMRGLARRAELELHRALLADAPESTFGAIS